MEGRWVSLRRPHCFTPSLHSSIPKHTNNRKPTGAGCTYVRFLSFRNRSTGGRLTSNKDSDVPSNAKCAQSIILTLGVQGRAARGPPRSFPPSPSQIKAGGNKGVGPYFNPCHSPHLNNMMLSNFAKGGGRRGR